MSIEPTRMKFIRLGRRYGSPQVIRQANRTLHGLELYLSALLAFGASRVDAMRLARCRDELLRLGGDRSEQRLWSMTSARERSDLVKKARSVRRQGQLLLGIAAGELPGRHDEDSRSALALVDATRARMRASVDDVFKLKIQLDDLSVLFSQSPVQEVLEENNVSDYVRQLEEARASVALVIDSLKAQPGTPETTEQINLLDGEIVTLCRRFRAIARLAGRELGRPALAAAFELNELYDYGRRKKAETPEAPEAAPDGGEESAAG